MPKKKVDSIQKILIQQLPEQVTNSQLEDKIREIINYINDNG